MSNQTYDLLKWLALIAIPAIVALVAALGEIWGIPHSAQVAASISAFAVCLGTCLDKSSKNYAEKKFDDDADEEARDDIEVKADEVTE
jgi:putative effector of murein hydrolase LrgA (UPF0299 family)